MERLHARLDQPVAVREFHGRGSWRWGRWVAAATKTWGSGSVTGEKDDRNCTRNAFQGNKKFNVKSFSRDSRGFEFLDSLPIHR
jgi:hypothetical protein